MKIYEQNLTPLPGCEWAYQLGSDWGQPTHEGDVDFQDWLNDAADNWEVTEIEICPDGERPVIYHSGHISATDYTLYRWPARHGGYHYAAVRLVESEG